MKAIFPSFLPLLLLFFLVESSAFLLIWLKMNKNFYALIRASPLAQLVKNLPAMRETWVRSLSWEDPPEKAMVPHSSILRRKWQPTLVFFPGKSHGHRTLVGYSPWGHEELATT